MWPRLGLALLSGLVASLATPPWGFWPLGIAGLAGLAGCLTQTDGWRSRAATGYAFAFGMFAVTLFWMSEFHAVGYAAAAIGYAGFYSAAVAVVPVNVRRAGLLALPAALTIIEWIRVRFPFGGVPLGSIEIGQAGGPLLPAAGVFGALSLLTLAATVGVAIVLGMSRKGSTRNRQSAAALLLGVVAVVGLAAIAPDGGRDERSIRVGVVQGGGERGLRAVSSDRRRVLLRHEAVSATLRPPLDLVLWPENAIDVTELRGSDADQILADLATRLQATVVAGVTEDAPNDRFVNVAYAYAPNGEVVDRYTKVKRVPFGEYVPGRSLFERVVDLSILPRDAVAGTEPGVLKTPAGQLGVGISYEVFFSDRARDAVRAGAEVLLVPTNAASFSTSQVPTQQVSAARLRAVETGRWLVQSAPTGYSAVVDPTGRVRDRSVLGLAQTVTAEVQARRGRTLYARWGDLPVVAGAALVLAAAWRRRGGRDQTGST
ncbi:MAG: apolipoprotein N-acyltransferase [Acidimicrobiales bacterium]